MPTGKDVPHSLFDVCSIIQTLTIPDRNSLLVASFFY